MTSEPTSLTNCWGRVIHHANPNENTVKNYISIGIKEKSLRHGKTLLSLLGKIDVVVSSTKFSRRLAKSKRKFTIPQHV